MEKRTAQKSLKLMSPKEHEKNAFTEEQRERLKQDHDPRERSVCAAFGKATSTQHSADVCWKGKPEPTGNVDQSVNLIENPRFPCCCNTHRTSCWRKNNT